MKTTPSPAAEWPPGGAGSSTRTASQGRASTDFGALLDTHQARTASAEGPKTEAKLAKDAPVAPEQAHAEPNPADAPRGDAPAQAAAERGPQAEGEQPAVGAPAAVVEAVVEFVPAPVIAESVQQPVAEPPLGAPAQVEQPELQLQLQQQLQQQQQHQQQQQLPGQGPVAAAAAPAAAPALDVAAAPIAPQAAAAQPQAPQPVAAEEQQPAAAPEQPVVRADRPAQSQPQGQQQPQQQAGDGPRPQQQPAGGPPPHQQQPGDDRPADGARAATSDQPVQQRAVAPTATEPRAERAQPQPVQANAGTTALTSAAAPAAPQAAPNRTDAPVRSVPLSHAADAVENVIRLGSQRGVTHARLSLRPADLGGVEIRLQQTAAGLTASVVAEGAEAAQALQHAGSDLRRQLESHGIQLQSLDISYSGDDPRDARSAEAQSGDGEPRPDAGDSSSTATDGGEPTPTEEIGATATLELPDGVLVDVLA